MANSMQQDPKSRNHAPNAFLPARFIEKNRYDLRTIYSINHFPGFIYIVNGARLVSLADHKRTINLKSITVNSPHRRRRQSSRVEIGAVSFWRSTLDCDQ